MWIISFGKLDIVSQYLLIEWIYFKHMTKKKKKKIKFFIYLFANFTLHTFKSFIEIKFISQFFFNIRHSVMSVHVSEEQEKVPDN